MIQRKSKVLWNEPVRPGYYRLGFEADADYGRARPGQFVMVHLGACAPALLRRPFSIHRLVYENRELKGVELLYRVVGAVTRQLCTISAGEVIDVLGPLGRGFSLPTGADRQDIVAGGIGVAPLLFLAEYMAKKGVRTESCRVFIGGRTQNDILCRADFERLGMSVQITTDDGTYGEQCLVTEPLRTALMESPPDMLYACGPEAMLGCTIDMAALFGVKCQISIESMMACGMGACLGCAVRSGKRTGGYLHVCRDGPVFDSTDVRF